MTTTTGGQKRVGSTGASQSRTRRIIFSEHTHSFWQLVVYDFEVLRTLRGRPTLRSLTASRSFGSISHSRPNLNAFKRFALIIARTLFVVTPNRLAASAVVMIFMAQSIPFCEIMASRHNFS